ncbi:MULTISPECIES: capsular polysaccharide synthesis protein [unclassified Streptomyces]|uniref:capsular polysaccharide synthesis protein n=1 Tax=unclassified Streptomyces TaxID=2593676 RepID=UPI000BAC5FF6|nr:MULTISPECIES: capsular polysaccharide synthesis protein [unclassified Streptomyces]ASY33184.1 hypothetical protein CAC01_11210 [Streptomyces sp. CLI2509]MYX24122.1 hypothetical protein [Streptomyces sp. SID8380]
MRPILRRPTPPAAAEPATLGLDPRRPGLDVHRLYEVGEALEKHRELKHASWVYLQAIAHDPTALPVDRQLVNSEPQRFKHRRIMARFVNDHLPELKRRVRTMGPVETEGAPKLFVFWEQGFDDAPPVVRSCRRRLEKMHAGEIVDLDLSGLRKLVDLPHEVYAHASKNRAHFADVARFALLHRYGGAWLDATCLVTESVTDRLPELLNSGFFAFRYHDALISNWFIASKPGNYITGMVYQGLCEYWRRRDIDVNYYFNHHLFESLYYLDPEFAQVWDRTPDISSHPPHALQRAMHDPFTEERLQELLDQSFIHKLTYKRDTKPGSFLEHIEQETF